MKIKDRHLIEAVSKMGGVTGYMISQGWTRNPAILQEAIDLLTPYAAKCKCGKCKCGKK